MDTPIQQAPQAAPTKPIVTPGKILKKETPRLTDIFKKKVVEETVDEEPEVKRNGQITSELINSSWAKFIEEKELDGAIRMVLSNDKELSDDGNIEVILKNQIETKLLAQIEKDLVLYIRNDLKNDHIQISHKVNMGVQETKPYTNAEIFTEMAKRNPTLLKLRDELGLDTDY